jgi:CheY-like chemotaxis protein
VGHLVPDPPYVLLVLGDERLREEAAQALYGAGFVPLLATNGADAANYMAGVSVPVLILLDLDTPGLDAVKLTARFRADARWSRVRVIVTGSVVPEGLPVDGVLTKPFTVEQLVGLARGR